MNKKIKMITFDLDDTLWDNRPTITNAEIETRKWHIDGEDNRIIKIIFYFLKILQLLKMFKIMKFY